MQSVRRTTLAKLLPKPEELPKGASLVKPTPELLKEAPAWAKTNPAIVTSAADRKEALKDYQPDALDLTRLRNLAVFVFECETPQGTAASTGIAVYAVELADSNVVKEWQKTVMEAMTKFRFQRVRFIMRENLLLWLVYSQDGEAECETLERTMAKKLEDFAKAEHKATSGR